MISTQILTFSLIWPFPCEIYDTPNPPEYVTKHNHVKILTCHMTHIIILTLCESFLPIAYELLFRHIFETQIHIQTQIRKNFILSLVTKDFL